LGRWHIGTTSMDGYVPMPMKGSQWEWGECHCRKTNKWKWVEINFVPDGWALALGPHIVYPLILMGPKKKMMLLINGII
jgi:hypothetical protein